MSAQASYLGNNKSPLGEARALLELAAATPVRELMSAPPLLVDFGEPIVDVATDLLASGAGIAIVVDLAERPVGTVTLADLLRVHVELAREPADDAEILIGFGQLPTPERIGDIADRHLLCVAPDAALATALQLMSYEAAGYLLVTAGEQLVGVLGCDDVAMWLAQRSWRPRQQAQPVGVLVVDDDADMRACMRDVLELEGYDVHLHTNATSALCALEQLHERLGLVLLDLMLPGMSGWEFLDRRAERAELRAVPVVVVTGCRPTGFRGATPTALVQKPLQLDRLLEVVRAHARN